MLDFDTSRLPFGTQAWSALLGAIESANENDETDWLEWKGTLSLRDKGHIAKIARAIVAFANRTPADAAASVGGHGILVVGVEPGSTQGLDPRDPAELEPAVNALLGDDGPRWQMHWIPYKASQVLIIVVAAPAAGDPIHRIVKSSADVQDGDVFVRKPGRSVRATDLDLGRLSDRLTARDAQTNIDLRAGAKEATRLSVPPLWADNWLRNETDRCLAPLRKTQGVAGLVYSNMPGLSQLSGSFGQQTMVPEDRTFEQYEAEVDQHIERCARAIDAAIGAALRSRLPPLEISAVNLTDRNFENLEVKLHFEGDVAAHERRQPIDVRSQMPRPPRPWGPRESDAARMLRSAELGRVQRAGMTPRQTSAPAPRPRIENGGSAAITFPPTHLRPRHTVQINRSVVLEVLDRDAVDVRCTWKATATNTDGEASGSFVLPIVDVIVDDLADSQ